MKYLVLYLYNSNDEHSLDHERYFIANDLKEAYEHAKVCWVYDANPEDILKSIRVLPLDGIPMMRVVVKQEFILV